MSTTRNVLVLAFTIVSAHGCGGSEPVDTTPLGPTLSVFAGQNQSAAVGAEVPIPPTVRVVNVNGSPTDAVVTFRITAGGGSILANTVATGENGLAKAEHWVMGAVGRNTLTATLVVNPSQVVTFTATGIAAASGR
jgi:hypothetical protein